MNRGITQQNSYRLNWITPPAQFTSRPRRNDNYQPPVTRKQSWVFYVVLVALAAGGVYLLRRR